MSAQQARTLLDRGLSKPSLFQFSIPNNDKTESFRASDYLDLYCKSVVFPEITHDVILSNGHFRTGVVTQQPTGFKYNKPLVITMVERSDYYAYEEFRQWFDRTGFKTNDDDGAQNMRYKDDYTTDITLKKFEIPTFPAGSSKGTNIYGGTNDMEDGYRHVWTVDFINAFITSIGNINYSSDAVDAMVEYDVEFYYDMYKIKFTNKG